MKRIILTFALASVFAVNAQNNAKLERALFVRDSVAKVLNEYRERYAKNEAERQQIKPTIIQLEKDVARLHAEYEAQLKIVSQEDIKRALAEYDKACKEAEEERKKRRAEAEKLKVTGETSAVKPVNMKSNLVANSYFEDNLSPKDYTSLCESQLAELKIKELAELYTQKYGELLTLQGEYMDAPTKEKADKVAILFAAKEREMAGIDQQISSLWSKVYDNKVYAYDWLMERDGKVSIIDRSAKIIEKANREVETNRDIYQSGALVEYYVRKKAITEYETEIASMLSIAPACDSLKKALLELNNRDYRLSKLHLPYRSFIVYEDVEIKKGSSAGGSSSIQSVKVYNYGVIYRVRVGLFASQKTLSDMRGARPVYYSKTTHSGYYAYYIGGFRTEQDANIAAERLKNAGFQEPIVSVWVNGRYYPTIEDMSESETQYSLNITGISSLTDEMKKKVSGYSISRNGSAFVVGMFLEKSMADSIAADLRALGGGDLEVEVKSSKQ